MPPKSSLRRTVTTLTALALAAAAYVVSYRVTEIEPLTLIKSLPKAGGLLREMTRLDLFTRPSQTKTLDLVFPVPCGSAPEGPAPSGKPTIHTSVPCADARTTITVQGEGFLPKAEVKIQWLLPTGYTLFSKLAEADDRGNFSVDIEVRPITATADGIPSHLQAEASYASGGLQPSQTLKDVTDNIMVTIFMALLATTLGSIIAAPLSFLAARNVMGRGAAGTGIYYLVRSIFNLTRAYEPLVLATVLALWVGFGSFAGVLALTIVTVASLGKLFSEAVESIDHGPVEAVTATGSRSVHVVQYAIVPQIVPDFISYIIYHWDINVRISTILGFVGGGGIGYYLSQRISVLEYGKAGTAIAAIVAVVWAMDFLSAEIRKRYT